MASDDVNAELNDLMRRASLIGYVVVPECLLRTAAKNFEAASESLTYIRAQHEELQAHLVEFIMLAQNTDPERRKKLSEEILQRISGATDLGGL